MKKEKLFEGGFVKGGCGTLERSVDDGHQRTKKKNI